MQQEKLPQQPLSDITASIGTTFDNEQQWKDYLLQNNIKTKRHIRIATEAVLVGALIASGFPTDLVIMSDDAGQFVIPVLSGHVGGANAYAEKIAKLTNGTAVLTTASDVGKTIPVDILGRELGWKVEAPKINITRVSAHVVNEEPIAFVQEAGEKNWWTRPTPLPENIHLFDCFEDVDLNHFKALLWVTNKQIPDAVWKQLNERLVVYRPSK
ncbi:MAG: cobalamin biosynthesis central domain-containing protein [Methylococcales bacterium]